MRRIFVLLLILIFSLTAVIVVAQEDPLPDAPTPVAPDESVNNVNAVSRFANLNASPFVINAGEGSDFCDSATTIDTGQGGTQMDVASLTQSPDDPILNCMWGSPSDSRGYRTVWYQFTPGFNGSMTLSTLPASSMGTNAYDTVLAVHTGSCGSLTTVACNDDAVGFSSTLTMEIRRNTTYYIEVADWNAGGNAIKTLDLSLQINNFDSEWKLVNSSPPNFTLTSRHATVVIGPTIYFMGGRGAGGTILPTFQKLNTNTGNWTPMTPIRGGGLLNTTAVYLPDTNRIYIPGGSIQASDQTYTRDHKFYDFATGLWEIADEPVGGDAVTDAFAYAAAAPNNAGDGYFLTGGVIGYGSPVTTTSTSTTLDQVLFYQPDLDLWVEKKEMSSPRYGHVAANVNGKLCVAGGVNTNGAENVILNAECASGVSPSEWFSTEPMNFARYFSHSSVGSDGRWYVYGGIDGNGAIVPEVEVYDPDTNSWSVFGYIYDVGGQNGRSLVWPGGGFAGNYLWLAGGSFDPTGNELNPQITKAQFLKPSLYLPIILNDSNASNHSFANALSIPFNKTISQNFSSNRILTNVYKFDLDQLSTVKVTLASVPANAFVWLYLYGDNKDIIQSHVSPPAASEREISIPLGQGSYYVAVRYLFSPNPDDFNDYYQLRVSK